MGLLRSIACVVGMLSLAFSSALVAEQGKMMLHVADTHGKAVGHLWFANSGPGGGSKETDVESGRVQLVLAPDTKANSVVPVQIVRSPRGHDFVMVSPWDGNVRVPSFENSSMNFADVVVAERGDKEALLVDGRAIGALAAKINQANAPKTAGRQAEVSPKESLEAVSKQYGLAPEEVDRAIRTWGEKATDPYDIGLAALYARNYPEATKQLTVSLEAREKSLKGAQEGVVDAAKFLGESLYAQGRYREAAVAQDRALQLRPDDHFLLNAKGSSLLDYGDYAGAEPLYRHALAVDEKDLGKEHPRTAVDLNNLAEVLRLKRNYAGAEPLYRRALAIDEKALGPMHPETAVDLDNLAELLREEDDYIKAEPLFRRALAIDEKALGPEHRDTAIIVNNLALLLEKEGDYQEAEALFRRALAISEKTLVREHPAIAVNLSNLALLLYRQGNYEDAEPLFRRALAIKESAFGPHHPETAASLSALGLLLIAKGDFASAEPLIRRALYIDETALGRDDRTTQVYKKLLAALEAKLR